MNVLSLAEKWIDQREGRGELEGEKKMPFNWQNPCMSNLQPKDYIQPNPKL